MIMDEYKIVIIDDNMHNRTAEPFVHTIAKLNPKASIQVLTDPSEGFQYIMENLQSKMIVFLDCKFDGTELQGIDILHQIREKTSLVYIVMMSANKPTSFSSETLIDLINADFISFFDRSLEADSAMKIIEKVKRSWQVRFDCVLESWIQRHPEDQEKVVLRQNNESFTWRRILEELHQQTNVGKSFEGMIHKFYIYQFPEIDQ